MPESYTFEELQGSKGFTFEELTKPEPSEPPPFVPSPDIISGEQAEREGISPYDAPTWADKSLIQANLIKAGIKQLPGQSLLALHPEGRKFIETEAEIGAGFTSPTGLAVGAGLALMPQAALPAGIAFGGPQIYEGLKDVLSGELGTGAAKTIAGAGMIVGGAKGATRKPQPAKPPPIPKVSPIQEALQMAKRDLELLSERQQQSDTDFQQRVDDFIEKRAQQSDTAKAEPVTEVTPTPRPVTEPSLTPLTDAAKAEVVPEAVKPADLPKSAAMRDKETGEVWYGEPTHAQVLDKIPNEGTRNLESGFATESGKFLTYDETANIIGKPASRNLEEMSAAERQQWIQQKARPAPAPETAQTKQTQPTPAPVESVPAKDIPPDLAAEIQKQKSGTGPLTKDERFELNELRQIKSDRGKLGLLNEARLEHLESRSQPTPEPQRVRPGEEDLAGPGSPSAREMEAKVKLPAQANAEKLQRQFELFDQEIGDALTTGGQFLAKELRPDVAKGKPAEKGTVTSKQINQHFVSKLSTLMQELKRVRLEVQRTADIDTQRYFRLIEDRAKNAFRQVQELRRTSHESLYFWNQIRAEYQDIARAIGQAPEMKQFKPVIDQLVKDARQGDWEAFRRHLVEYPRVNLFTLGSWTLDFGTNLLATATKLPTWSVLDLGSIVSGKPAVRVSSFLRALALSGKNVIPEIEKFRLPPEIESRLGTTAGGELAGYGKEILVDFSEILRNHPQAAQKLKEVDRLLSAPARMKRAVDNFFGRLGAATELRVAAFEEARKLGLKGDEQAAFVENFIQAPDTVSMERAVKAGKELKFNRDLSAWEEQISQSIGVKLFAETYPRWTFQFMRWASEMVGVNPGLWKRMVKGEAKASEVTDYFVKAATGWGGIWAFNQLFYKNVDPNTMEYIREDGNRTRLSGRTPMPELYFINALLRGDTSNAKAALAHLSIPGARMLGGEPGGLLSPIIQTMSESIKGRYTAERTATELEKIANDAIPGKSVLGFIRALYDPSVREGFGAPIPGVSEALPQRVNPTTGEPLSPAQRIPGTGIKLPTVGGTPFPGGVRVLNQVEQALLDHGLGLTRPRRTSLIELPAEDVPKNVRREYEQVAGRRVNEFIMEGINDPDFAAQPFEVRRKLLQHWLSAARRTARSELAEKYGFSAKPVESLPLPVERLPESLKGEYRRAK